MIDNSSMHFRWISLDGHDRLRWQSTRKVATPEKYRLYVADAKGDIEEPGHPLLDMLAPPWQVDIEVKSEWYEKYLTVRFYDGESEYVNKPTPPVVWIPKPGSACRLGSTDMPFWQEKLNPQARAAITQTDYYQHWLETSTDRCTDLSRLENDNTLYLPLKWRTDSRILFHGDEEQRSPDEIFKTGLTPPEPWGGLKMRPGLYVGAFESFSYSFNCTMFFETGLAIDGIPESRLGYIYLVDTQGGLMVDESLGTNVNFGEQEVAFPGGVQSRWIIGAFTVGNLGKLPISSSYQPNPHYVGKVPAAVAGMTRVIVSCWDPVVRISLRTAGKFEVAILDSHGVGFVEMGKPFTIELHDASGAKVSAQWAVNGILAQGSRSYALSLAKPEAIGDTNTILIEASRIQGYIPLILSLNKLGNDDVLRADIVPPDFTVSYEIVDKQIHYTAKWPALPQGVNTKSVEIWEIYSVDGDESTAVLHLPPSKDAEYKFAETMDATYPLSADHFLNANYYFYYFVMRYMMNDNSFSCLSRPAHPVFQPTHSD